MIGWELANRRIGRRRIELEKEGGDGWMEEDEWNIVENDSKYISKKFKIKKKNRKN